MARQLQDNTSQWQDNHKIIQDKTKQDNTRQNKAKIKN